MFYYNYVSFCNKIGKSPSAVAEDMGYQRSVVTRWSKGTVPRQATLQKIANYFGVTVSELIAEDENKKSPAPEGAELIPNYSKLSDTNKAIVDSMIAQLLAAQSEG